MFLLLLTAMASTCPDGAGAPGVLDRALEDADAAIAALDLPALDDATERVEQALGCAELPIRVEQAATTHRILGVASFVRGDEGGSAAWFEASRAIDPGAALGHAIGGPIESAWQRALPRSPPARVRLPEPRVGTLRIDGQALDSRPVHLPYVFQRVDGQTVLQSALVGPGALPDPYPTREPEAFGVERHRSRGWAAVAASVGAASVGALSGAAITRGRFRSSDLSDAEAEALVPLNRALGIGGYAGAGAALGLGAVAVVVGEW